MTNELMRYYINLLNENQELGASGATPTAAPAPTSEADAMKMVGQDGLKLQTVPEELKTPRVCLIAVMQNGLALKYVPEEVKAANPLINDVAQAKTQVRS